MLKTMPLFLGVLLLPAPPATAAPNPQSLARQHAHHANAIRAQDPTALSLNVDATSRFQIFAGFGASLTPIETPQIFWLHDPTQPQQTSATFAQKEALADLLYRRLGIARTRMVLSGFEPQNDNEDPWTLEPTGFDWTSVDPAADFFALSLPFGLRTPWLSFAVDGGEAESWLRLAGSSCALDPARLDEEVEWLYAAILHLAERGLEPPFLAINNEPDLCADEDGHPRPKIAVADLVTIVKRLGARLRDAGVATQFVISDGWTPQASLPYMTAVLADPEARPHVAALAYHAYDGYDSAELVLNHSAAGAPPHEAAAVRGELATLSAQHGLPLWMTEICYCTPRHGWDEFTLLRARLNHLHDELTLADAAAYDVMNLYFIARPGVRDELVEISFRKADPGQPEVGALDRFEISRYGYLIGHYSRFATPGSQRVAAATSDVRVRAVAFARPNGLPVVVVLNNLATSARIDLHLAGFAELPQEMDLLTSDSGAIWKPGDPIVLSDGRATLVLPPESVTTLSPAQSSVTAP